MLTLLSSSRRKTAFLEFFARIHVSLVCSSASTIACENSLLVKSLKMKSADANLEAVEKKCSHDNQNTVCCQVQYSVLVFSTTTQHIECITCMACICALHLGYRM